MKKFVSMFLALAMCLSLAAPAFAIENEVVSTSYEYEILGDQIIVTYTLICDSVEEQISICRGDQIIVQYQRIVTPDGNAQIFANGNYIDTIHLNYSEFLSMAKGETPTIYIEGESKIEGEAVAHTEIYEICGSTLYHMFVEESSSTVDLEWDDTKNDIVVHLTACLINVLHGPIAGAGIEVLYRMAEYYKEDKHHGARYMDIKEKKYFVADSVAGICYNCYHCDIKFYDLEPNGEKKIKYAYWDWYRELL